MKNFRDQYRQVAVQELTKTFGLPNPLAAPKVEKVVLNVGVGRLARDEHHVEAVERTLTRITGQKPIRTLAKKSISSFKIREGMPIGVIVTLRGKRMDDFLTKLINVALPRVRDFRGLSPKSVDAQGNLAIGFHEHLAFPEIRSDEVEHLHGLEVVISTTAGDRTRGLALFKALGFPIREE